jgi:ribonuclease P protein component
MKRRFREALRLRLSELSAEWDIVINPRRAALTASPEELQRALDRLVTRCGKQ